MMNRSIKWGFRAAALMLVFAPVPALAQACPGIRLSVQQVSGEGYDPAAHSNLPVQIRLQSETGRLHPSCVQQLVTITAAGALPLPLEFALGGTRLATRFDTSINGFRVQNQIRLTPAARQKIVAGDPVILTVAEVTSGQFVRAGLYLSQIEIAAGDAFQTATLTTTVRPVMRLQRSSADGIENIELGDPRRGAQGATAFFYRTNADVALTVTSENRGKLVHTEGASTVVPYSAAVAGRTLRLEDGPIDLQLPFSGLNLQARTVTVTVPPTGPIFAGRYKDVLTLSFTPY